MQIYRATIENIDELIQIRIDFLKMDKGHLSNNDEKTIQAQLRKYFEKHIPLGDFVAVIARIDNKIASAAFMTIQERPANPSFITGLTATLLNVVTYSEYRKKGIASKVIRAIIEEARSRQVSLIELSATEDGKHLYKKLGFAEPAYTAMRLSL